MNLFTIFGTIGLKSEQFNKGIQDAAQKGNKFAAGFSKASDGIKKTAVDMGGAFATTGKYIADIPQRAKEAAESIGKAFGADKRAEINKLNDQLKKNELTADTLRARFEEVKLSLAKIQTKPILTYEDNAKAETLKARLEEIGYKIDQTESKGEQLKKSLDGAMTPKPIDRFKKAISGAGSLFGNWAKKAVQGTLKVGKGLLNATKKMTGLGKGAKSAGNAFANLGKRILRLASAALVFNVFRKGFTELRKYLGGLLNTNAQFTKSLNTIKVNLMTAFQPIFEAIIPALNALMSGLATASAHVAHFTAALFGKTAAQSKASAKALNQQADAMKNTGKEAKNAQKSLLSFDDVQKLTQETSENSSDIGKQFDEALQISAPSFLDDILDSVKSGNWEELGATIAEKINSAISKIQWSDIGTKIGGFLQSAFETGYGFLKNIDTQQIGDGVADLFNNVFSTLKPETVGGTIAEFINRLVDLLYGFITKAKWSDIGKWLGATINSLFTDVDWGKLGKTIGDFIKGVFDLVIGFLQETDWEKIGSSIVELVGGIDWAGVLGKIVQFIYIEIPIALARLLKGIIVELGKAIGSWFGKRIEEEGGNIGAGILRGIADIFVGIYKWLKKYIFDPFVDGIKKLFGIHSPSTVMADIGGYLIKGLWNGIKDAKKWLLDKIGGFVGDVVGGIKGFFGIKSPSKVFAEMGKMNMQGLAKGFTDNVNFVKNKIGNAMDSVMGELDNQYNVGVNVGTSRNIAQQTIAQSNNSEMSGRYNEPQKIILEVNAKDTISRDFAFSISNAANKIISGGNLQAVRQY